MKDEESAALALLQKIGRVPAKHSGVISLFDTEFVKKGIFPTSLSKDFHKAFRTRQISDYRLIEPLSPQAVEKMWKSASDFVEAVHNYLLSHKQDSTL